MPVPRLSHEVVAKITPRGGLQAAEFEDRGLGALAAEGRSVTYRDLGTGIPLLSLTYASAREAGMQMAFFRETYADVKRRRGSLHVVRAGAAIAA